MDTFAKEQSEMLKAQATEILRNFNEEQNIRDLMAQIYVDNLDDKTPQQGRLTAADIWNAVETVAVWRSAERIETSTAQ